MDFIRKNLIHFLLWGIYFILFFYVVNERISTTKALALTIVVTGIHSGIFYFNYSYLVPGLYLNQKRVLYFISVILLVGILGFIGSWTIGELINRSPFPPRFMMSTNVDGGVTFMEPPFFFRTIPILVPAIMLLMVSYILKRTEHSRIIEQELESLKAENYETELKFLRSQINPHFLFNSLNNIYSLSITKSDKTPGMLVKLSSMLRYLIYECNVDKVPVDKEVDYIRNYIELQKLKDDQISNIQFSYTETSEEISPMLLMPFVENAFKHSKIEDIDHGWIDISLSLDEPNLLVFVVENSVPAISSSKDTTGGVGIKNVQKRLELLYPNKHTLHFFEGEGLYRVIVKIELYDI